ncbi:hypothetical protein BJ912DRAFT_1151202 [Pholiota molesta]|nr:hypothetical protein BJ912DRAFT_1151202 [Pholiota molesta]
MGDGRYVHHSTTERRRGVTGCSTHGVPWTTTARLTSVGDDSVHSEERNTRARFLNDIGARRASVEIQIESPGTGATQHGHDDTTITENGHGDAPIRSIYGHRSVVRNETTTLEYRRLAAWHCLYDNGSDREGVGDQSNSAQLRENCRVSFSTEPRDL